MKQFYIPTRSSLLCAALIAFGALAPTAVRAQHRSNRYTLVPGGARLQPPQPLRTKPLNLQVPSRFGRVDRWRNFNRPVPQRPSSPSTFQRLQKRFRLGSEKLPVPPVLRDAGLQGGVFSPYSARYQWRFR